jgi:hypothetical protein
MTLRWRRRGLVAAPTGDDAWATHAQVPTVLELDNRLWRIYVAARNVANRSRVVAIDVDPGDGMRVLRVHPRPVLAFGAPGAFDADGVGPSCVLRVGDRIVLYYVGMAVAADVPYQSAIGCAVSDDGGLTFERLAATPIFGPVVRASVWVSMPMVRDTLDGHEMVFTHATRWSEVDGRLEAEYGIAHTRSRDGLAWDDVVTIVRDPRAEHAAGLTRAWIATTPAGETRLWYARRGPHFRRRPEDAYRIASVPYLDVAAATTADADPVRFANPPQSGDWDDAMQSYASIVPLDGTLVMLYNGNGFGHGGFGWAVLEES